MTKSEVHEVDGIFRRFVIRTSTNEDLRQIYEWLQEEERLEVHGNFLCNWNLTERCHQESQLLVLIDELECIPVAYQWGQLLQSGILQVRYGWRGKGLGRLVVQHCVELALEQDEMVLRIECKPSSSVPFWKAMGFTIVTDEDGYNPKGFRVLSKQLVLPLQGSVAEVTVSMFPEIRKWQDDVLPVASITPKAVLCEDGKEVYLSERAVFATSFLPAIGDPVIEILVNGSLVYRDKAKYEDARNRGVHSCRNGFYIDSVAM
ncbi:MAG: GNAT family N-acetyltransferase [Burkholderiales bacterium]|nr:GNAT family N-acetyltransferase [Nitrosomonas sp.]MCP5275113.1 GNAT family N-acetyltransferase [Burkholderiales bacterium]